MRKISIILSLLLSAALAVAVFKIVQTINLQQKEKEDFQIIANLVVTPLPEETSSPTDTQEPKKEETPVEIETLSDTIDLSDAVKKTSNEVFLNCSHFI